MIAKLLWLIMTDKLWHKTIVGGGFIMLIVIGIFDYSTGYTTKMSGLYLIPVCLIAAVTGIKGGYIGAIIASIITGVADYLDNACMIIMLWNVLMSLITNLLFVIILVFLRDGMIKEHGQARRDNMTGLYNLTAYYELAGKELNLSKNNQQFISTIYLDCDNFKTVNDKLGHAVGDKLLKTVANILRIKLRDTDLIFRWGGDEFIVLLPNTDENEAKNITQKIQTLLLAIMEENHWPVTFSIGVATFRNLPQSLDEMLMKADRLMYCVKVNGKNGIRYAVY